MELTDNDKQRIHAWILDQCEKGAHHWPVQFAKDSAEYATRYEREQQSKELQKWLELDERRQIEIGKLEAEQAKVKDENIKLEAARIKHSDYAAKALLRIEQLEDIVHTFYHNTSIFVMRELFQLEKEDTLEAVINSIHNKRNKLEAERTELRNKEWTDILTTSELNDYAKQYWTSKLIGGVEPNLTDMFIAGFRLGVEKTKELP